MLGGLGGLGGVLTHVANSRIGAGRRIARSASRGGWLDAILGIYDAKRNQEAYSERAEAMMAFMMREYEDQKRRQLDDKKNRIALFSNQREENKLALSKLSNQERLDTISAFKELSASQRQRITAQGLGNTSISSVLERGVKRDEVAALNRQRDLDAMRRISVQTSDTERLASAFFTPGFDTSGVQNSFSALLNTPFAPSTTGAIGLYANALLQGLIRAGLASAGGAIGARAGAGAGAAGSAGAGAGAGGAGAAGGVQ